MCSGSEDNTIRIWDELGNCVKVLQSSMGPVYQLIVWKDCLISDSFNTKFCVWNENGECIKTLNTGTLFLYVFV